MAAKTRYDLFVKRAVELGALESKIIKTESIITAPWVRLKCQFGCSGYDSNLCCPPNTPTPEETRRVLECYRSAVLLHGKKLGAMTGIIVKLEREIYLAGFYKAFGLGSGPCSVCKSCSKASCKHPEKTRPSMEACGVDVYATARLNGLPIDVVRDHASDENYYGVVLIE